VRRTAGGSGLNVLRAAQWVLGQPDVCTFIGCIGNDENGRLLLQSANEAGVQPICQVVDDPTSVCVVLVTDVERSMCSFQNASGKFDFQQFLQKQTQEIFERASIIYLSVGLIPLIELSC
jgi:adenosine kinase